MARTLTTRALPASRELFPGFRYWDESAQRRAQRWYIHLCLFAAAVHDRFVALEESSRHNMNWSATMSYYSVVHTCRGVLFQCFGDFPKSHQDLSTFLNYGEPWPSDGRVRFNWFSGLVRSGIDAVHLRSAADAESVRAILDTFLRNELRSDCVADSLRQCGPLVTAAKELREDSNYEALLIAHERNHQYVTPAVDALCENMSNLASVFIDLAADALRAGLNSEVLLAQEQPSLQSLAGEFIRERLIPSIRSKLTDLTLTNFESWIDSIRLPATTGLPDDHWGAIAYEAFGEKRMLMGDYIRKIDEFGASVRTNVDGARTPRGFATDPRLK